MIGKWARSAAVAVACVAAVATPASATTLADALAIAYKTNPLLKAQQAALRATDEGVISARANLLPALSQTLTASRTIDYTRYSTTSNPLLLRNPITVVSLNTRLTMQLWDGGADRLTIKAARMNVLATRQALRSLEQQVLLLTVQAYMNVRRDQQFVRLARNNVRVLREQVRAAQDRFDVGEVTRTDVAQAQARLAAAIAQLEANRGNLQQSVDSYIAVVGKAPTNLRTPPPAPKIPGSPQEAEKVAKREHPDIMQAQFNAKSAEMTARSTAKNRNPTISFQLDHSLGGRPGGANPTTDQLRGQIVGQLDIYQGGRLDSNRRRDVALWQQSLANVQRSGYEVRQGVYNAYTALRTASASIRANREAVRAAQVAFEGVQEEAKLGARTTLDALDAEQELLSARSNLVTSIRDEYVATYQVLAAMGLLTARHLNLGVDIYDPDVNTRAVTRHQLGNLPKLDKKRRELLEKITKRRGN
ncbi:MAG: TolC family outer membrane protein [Pseudomonadota bacterium]